MSTGVAPSDRSRLSPRDHPASRIWGAIRLVHPFPIVIVVALSAGLIALAHHSIPDAHFMARALGVVLLQQIPVGSLNDYLDRHADAITQPDKPIPSGLVSPRTALAITIVALLALIPLALSFGLIPFVLALLGEFGGLAYDLWLKPTRVSFLGYLLGFLSLITWIWTVAGSLSWWFAVVYPAGAMALVAAHLAQSLPDIEGDREMGLHGLAVQLGPQRTFLAIVALYAPVAAGGLVLAAAARAPLAILAVAVSGGLLTLAASVWRSAAGDRASRILVFRILAPGIAILAFGNLLAISSLG